MEPPPDTHGASTSDRYVVLLAPRLLVFQCVWPLFAYVAFGLINFVLRKMSKPDQADAAINLAFTLMFIIYPSISSGLFSMFYCVPLEDGTSWLRIDLSLECSTGTHATMIAFTNIMIIIHVIGTPAMYSYLFFWKHHSALEALKEQELAEANKAKLEEAKKYVNNMQITIRDNEPKKPLLDPKELLPGYMLRLTGGYQSRTCASLTAGLDPLTTWSSALPLPSPLPSPLLPKLLADPKVAGSRMSSTDWFELFETLRKVTAARWTPPPSRSLPLPKLCPSSAQALR